MNRLYKTFLLLAFVLMSSSTFAQKLSVEPIEAKAGEQATMRVNISQPSETTVLQFCLQLPAGVTVNESGCAVGTAAANHTLSVNRMDSGDYLFVFYNLDFQQFTGGTLLTELDISDYLTTYGQFGMGGSRGGNMFGKDGQHGSFGRDGAEPPDKPAPDTSFGG